MSAAGPDGAAGVEVVRRVEVARRVAVRSATPADAAAIRRLQGMSASGRRLLDHDLARADRCCLVACHLATPAAATAEPGPGSGGEVVGYAAALVQLGEAQVLDIVVAPPWRGQRTGRQLLSALLTAVAARGAGATSLEVAADNVAAQALYRRCGFVVEGRRPRYYPDGSDALLMWRRPAADVTGAADDREDR